jgi:hypothetical protein
VNARATLLAAACALAACAGTRQGPARPPETPAALARPEPDPACHGTVQGLLARNGLETVTISLAVDASGRAEVVEFLSPELTPAAKLELQRAVAECAWAPRPVNGRVEAFTTTWVRARAR